MGEYSTKKSAEMFARAQKSLAGGLNSVARSPLSGFVPNPPYFERGKGSRIWDVDGNEYVDYAMGFGPLILGHRPPKLVEAVVDVIQNRGSTFGICHNLEYEAAEKVVEHLPAVDLVRFPNSGTEAVMLAIRLARGYTGRNKIVRFEGHYHGWGDPIHWNTRAPMGANGLRHAPRLVPGTSGIPESYGQELIIQPWNDPDLLAKTVKRRAHEIAAVITEPIMCNLGGTTPKEGYLKAVREICDANDVLLIFDEVITAFRLGLRGAQGYYGVKPDLTTMAKALGGGYPVAALGGRREIMELMGQHAVSSAGTYNGNVVSMAAVKATITELEKPGVYDKLFAMGNRLRKGLEEVIHAAGLPAVGQGEGPVVQVWFEDRPIVDYRDAMTRKSPAIYPLFAKAMHRRGVMFNAGQMGVWYVTTAHTEADIDFTIDAAREAALEVKAQL